jgi:hypothetical protein
MAARKNTRAARAASQKSGPIPRKSFRQKKPDFDAILDRLSETLSIITTVSHALACGEPTATVAVGDEIVTLRHGVHALRSIYSEIDLALLTVRS